MSTGAIDPIPAVSLDHGLAAIEDAALTGKISGKAASQTGTTVAKSTTQPDSSQLSPLAKSIAALQKLGKSDPAKYAQLTQQIAINLQSAAQTAQSQGNTNEAKQLTALAGDFSSASKSGQVSTLIHDLTSAATAASHLPSSTRNTTSNQLLTLLQKSESQSTQSATVDAAAIILNTLNASGIA